MKPYSAKKEAEKELQAKKEQRGRIFLLAFVGAGMMVTIWMMFALWSDGFAEAPSKQAPNMQSPNKQVAGKQIVGKELKSGLPFDLHSLYKGDNPPKGVVLNFYSTTCIPCIREAPDFNQLTKKYQPQGIHFYYVNVEKDAKLKRLESFIRRLEVSAPMILADAMQVRKDYNAYAMPKAVILDGSGKIAYEHEGFDPSLKATLSQKLEKLLL